MIDPLMVKCLKCGKWFPIDDLTAHYEVDCNDT